MVPGLNGTACLLGVRALMIVALLAALPLPVSAGPVALHAIADDGGSDDSAAGDPNADADGPLQMQPDQPEPSEDGTDGQPGAAAPEPPAGCTFRDGPLELVV